MNPFYFGTSERRIFGIYEPAAATATRSRAAVLCYPWGAEYVYAHRSMRQLALKLSMAGYHTLRFDFFGTGDSAGEMSGADLLGWQADVESAIEGIEDIVGAAHVTLIGLRLGANIAAAAASRHFRKIDALVLWDPIVSGEAYLRELGAAFHEPGGDTLEVNGFPLAPAMLRDLSCIDLKSIVAAPPAPSLMLVTQRMPAHDSLVPVEAIPGVPSLTLEYLTAECPWIEAATISGAVPVRVIQRIVDWLK